MGNDTGLAAALVLSHSFLYIQAPKHTYSSIGWENGPIPFLHISHIPSKTLLEPPWVLCIVSAEAVVSNPLQLMLLSSLQFLQPPWHLQIQLMVWPLDPSPLHNYIDLRFRSEPNPRRSTMSEVGVLQCGIIRIHTNIIRVLPCTYICRSGSVCYLAGNPDDAALENKWLN